jgi:hypothetical protein
MISAWTKHLQSEEDKQKFEKTVLASRATLNRLKELLEEEKAGLESAEVSPKIYDSPNWDYKQAHTNGFKAALKMVNKIITLDPKDSKPNG